MNRRDLFKGLGALVAGIAVEQAIPLGRVWSFPSQIVRLHAATYSVRYVRAYDPLHGRTAHRLDIGRDRELLISPHLSAGMAYQEVLGSSVVEVMERMRKRSAPLPHSEVLSNLVRLPEKGEITGMSWA